MKSPQIATDLTHIPDGTGCQEQNRGVTWAYWPCGDPAVAIIGYKGRTEGPYPMCGPCANHNVHNRQGVVLYVTPGEERWVQR